MSRDPYVLVVGSQKGGTGRTTAALALAWAWGRAGRRVTLADPDPTGAALLVAAGPAGRCRWPNVTAVAGVPGPGDPGWDADLVVVDGPALLGPAAADLLGRADGLVLTGLADPVALRTLPAASAALAAAQETNPRLDLLGLLIGMYDDQNPVQRGMLDRLRRTYAEVLVEPPVPVRAEVRAWPADPGAEPPAGPARDAFLAAARALDGATRPAAAGAATNPRG